MESKRLPILGGEDHAKLLQRQMPVEDIAKVLSVPAALMGWPEMLQAADAVANAKNLADKMRRDGFCLGNQILAKRWPELIERYRSSLCFCDDCERLRHDGVSWLGHHFSCAVHGLTVRECQWCMRQSLVTHCDCGPAPYRTPMSLMRKSHALVPVSGEALLARLRIAFWSRLSRARSFLKLSILGYFARVGLPQFEMRLRRRRHPVSERKCAVPGCEQSHPLPNKSSVSP